MLYKGLQIIGFVFCLSFWANAQAVYSGQITDVGSRLSLSDVSVELANSVKQTVSDFGGNFLLKNEAIDSLETPKNKYQFFNHAVLWDLDESVSVEVFNIDGRRIASAVDLGKNGSYLFPQFPIGVYFVRMLTTSERQSFKAFSNGGFMTVVEKNIDWYRSSVKSQSDTLLLSKEGYYSRVIPLQGQDSFLQLGLLKKSVDELHYFNKLIDPIAFDLISSAPSRTNDGEVTAVKIIFDQEDDLMYYMNTKRYALHYNFARDQLGFNQGAFVFNQTQYRENEERYLYPANLNYYKNLDKYIIHFVSANEIPCEKIKLLYQKIVETSYLEGKLFVLANRMEFLECDVPIITTEELYEGQNYQALNLTENFGYLKKVELDELEDTYLGRHDIALLNGIPNDVSVVAGIITTEFQTPLSHINVLSHNRKTPNMALRNGWDHPLLETLLDELVYLNVKSDSFEIRKATLEEATIFWQANEPQEIIELEADVSVKGLIDLYEADHQDVNVIGGKASNFAELLNVKLNSDFISTPEGAFGIPFYYYDQHIKSAGLDDHIEAMLANEDFIHVPAIREDMLKDLRKRIKDHPLDVELIDLVKNEIDNFENFPSFRFRSSTNAEDIESFSGAGLYNSHSAKKDDPDKTINSAIKKVWASLWNWRAFEERGYFKIVHTSCAMGILVHRSFPDEDANGVLITINLYNNNPGFIINVQFKEYSIVFPEPGVLHDQIMLLLWSIIPDQDFMAEYLTFSNIPELNGQTVLSNYELMELGAMSKAVRDYFFENVPNNCNCDINDFGLDIEFKVDSQVEDRKIYIKQARLFN